MNSEQQNISVEMSPPAPTGAITAMLEKDIFFRKMNGIGSYVDLEDILPQVRTLEEAQQKKAKEEVEEAYLPIQELVSKVYFHLTNGQVSKWDTDASVIISIVENISNESAKEEEREMIVGIANEILSDCEAGDDERSYYECKILEKFITRITNT